MTEEIKIRWQWSRFEELSVFDIDALMRLRQRVFVVEQQCPYVDSDGLDPSAWHLLGWTIREGRPFLGASARVFERWHKRPENASFGRLVTAPELRKLRLGTPLVQEVLRRCETVAPAVSIYIQAQAYLNKFYQRFGFEPISSPYLYDGIVHLDMLRSSESGTD